MQVCTSLQTDNHASTPPLCFLQAGCPSCRPTNSVKALKAHRYCYYYNATAVGKPTRVKFSCMCPEQDGALQLAFVLEVGSLDVLNEPKHTNTRKQLF